jgi:hypothetical protein
MDRALVWANETFVGCRIGHAQRHRCGRRGDDRRDVRFAHSQILERLRPGRQARDSASLAASRGFAAATTAVGTPNDTLHQGGATDDDPGRARRLPRTPARATPTRTAAVAPTGSRHIPTAGERAGAVDFARRGSRR